MEIRQLHTAQSEKSINYNSKYKGCAAGLKSHFASCIQTPAAEEAPVGHLFSDGERFLISVLNEDSNHWAEPCFVQEESAGHLTLKSTHKHES